MKQILLIAFLICCYTVAAESYTPDNLPNPHTYNKTDYVANPDNILSSTAKAQINALCAEAERLSEVELVVVAIREMDWHYDAFEFAQETFNTWGIGKKGSNTGVLILLVQDSRDIRIHTGGGMEGILPDALCSEIVEQTMIPSLKKDKWNEGIIAGVQAIVKEVTTPVAQQELLLGYQPKDNETSDMLIGYFILSFIVLIFGAIFVYKRLNGKPRSLNNIRYQYIQDGKLVPYLLACFFPFPMLFLAIYYHKKAKEVRLKPIACPECEAQMRRLLETEEDAYLNGSQQAEERVKTVDYDVWACSSCFNHLVLPYKLTQMKYSKCPHCGALTYSQVSDVILRSATTLREGKGEKTYRCEHCGHTKIIHYSIPKVVVVATGGSHTRGGFGGSGFSGGSFGGGISFGGGAGGKF